MRTRALLQASCIGLLVAGCSGDEFDIGGLAGDYVINGEPSCVAHVAGSHLSMACIDHQRDSWYETTNTKTAEFDFGETRVSGTYSESSRQENLTYGDVWEHRRTLTVTATKTAGGPGGGAFGAFAGSWTITGLDSEESRMNGTLEYSDSDPVVVTVQVSGNSAIFYNAYGDVAAVASLAGSILTVTGDVEFFAVHE